MKTIHLTETDLALVRHAMQAYLTSFGHDEADVRVSIRQVIARLSMATDDQSEDTELAG